VKAGAVGQELNQKHHKLVMQGKSRFLENLKSIRRNAGWCFVDFYSSLDVLVSSIKRNKPLMLWMFCCF